MRQSATLQRLAPVLGPGVEAPNLSRRWLRVEHQDFMKGLHRRSSRYHSSQTSRMGHRSMLWQLLTWNCPWGERRRCGGRAMVILTTCLVLKISWVTTECEICPSRAKLKAEVLWPCRHPHPLPHLVSALCMLKGSRPWTQCVPLAGRLLMHLYAFIIICSYFLADLQLTRREGQTFVVRVMASSQGVIFTVSACF